jgi:hypothetical protein
MNNIKKTVLALLAGILLLACKKDHSSGKQFLLSKVYEDGLLKLEYIYSSDKKPLRRNNYNTNSVQSVFNGFWLYQFSNTGLLEEATDFTKNSQFINKYTLQYDVNNRLTRMNELAGDNSIQYYYLYDYNALNHLTGYSLYNGGTNKKTIDAEFGYSADGKIAYTKRYTYLSGTSLYDSSTFVFEKNDFPSWWSYFELLPAIALPNGDRTFFDMNLSSQYYYYNNAPPGITNITYTNKMYNNAGLLIKQQVSSEITTIGPPVIKSVEKTYEYIY